MHGVKTYGINEKKALTGDWEELNKETYICNQGNIIYVTITKQLQTSTTSARKFKLINLLIFMFDIRLAKSKLLTFLQNSESLATLN